MTLNDRIGVLWIFGDFGLRDTFQERIAPKPIEIDIDKLRMKFFSTERRFRRSKCRFSKFKETWTQGHQSAVPPYKLRRNGWR